MTTNLHASHAPVVGIDASRNRSGGAKTHLLGILAAVDPRAHGIAAVHVWSYDALLRQLPDAPWLIKHAPPALERSLIHQVWWQLRSLPAELRAAGCEVLLTADAGSVCRFEPAIVMSRDMLSFEGDEIHRFAWTPAWVRLLLLRYVQARSLQRAAGALFLTRYAADVIQGYTGALHLTRIIPHGIGDHFRISRNASAPVDGPLRCVYVSNTDVYKHQWHVVKAVALLRARGLDLRLRLVGAGSGRAEALERLKSALADEDPGGAFVEVVGAVGHDDIPGYLAATDIFVFASSCENMPNTLVEAMAAGLPIACSRRGPMPEILADAGTYFDPEDPASIADAIEPLAKDPNLRHRLATRAAALSDAYSWKRCACETWAFLREVHAMRTLASQQTLAAR